jgi:hypothetical protein
MLRDSRYCLLTRARYIVAICYTAKQQRARPPANYVPRWASNYAPRWASNYAPRWASQSQHRRHVHPRARIARFQVASASYSAAAAALVQHSLPAPLSRWSRAHSHVQAAMPVHVSINCCIPSGLLALGVLALGCFTKQAHDIYFARFHSFMNILLHQGGSSSAPTAALSTACERPLTLPAHVHTSPDTKTPSRNSPISLRPTPTPPG